MSNSSIWSIYGTLSDATIPSHSETGSDSNEEILPIPQDYSLTIWLPIVTCSTLVEGVLPLNRGTVGVFNNRSRLGWGMG